MARTYRKNFAVRIANSVARLTMALGIAPRDQYILSVQGRKTGRMYSTPVYVIEDSPGRWLVAPYGEVPWVLNARRAGHVTLTKGSVAETVDLLEMNPNESAPILRKYLARARIMQPYFDVHPDSSDEAFVAEAPRHPVFQLSVGTQTGT